MAPWALGSVHFAPSLPMQEDDKDSSSPCSPPCWRGQGPSPAPEGQQEACPDGQLMSPRKLHPGLPPNPLAQAEAQLPEEQLKIESTYKRLSGLPRRGPLGLPWGRRDHGGFSTWPWGGRTGQEKEQGTQKFYSFPLPGTGVT